MPTLLSIDPGSTNFGWAVFTYDKEKRTCKLIEGHTVNLGGEHATIPAVCDRLKATLVDIETRYPDLDIALVEQQMKSFRQGIIQGYCCGFFRNKTVMRSAHRVKTMFNISHPVYVERKRLSQEAVLSLTGLWLDHNLCDSILQAYCFMKEDTCV